MTSLITSTSNTLNRGLATVDVATNVIASTVQAAGYGTSALLAHAKHYAESADYQADKRNAARLAEFELNLDDRYADMAKRSREALAEPQRKADIETGRAIRLKAEAAHQAHRLTMHGEAEPQEA